LIYGPEPAPPGTVRGRTVRGPSKASMDETLRATTRDLVHRHADELKAFGERRPAKCGYAMAPWIPNCPEPRCQAWFDEIVAWHAARFGPRYAAVSVMAAWALADRRRLDLRIADDSAPDPARPATIALDIEQNRDWATAMVGIHSTASRSDLHDLVDRMWPEIERVRTLAQTRPIRPGRTGVLDRPARTAFWRLRRHEGRTLLDIATEWEALTRTWMIEPERDVPIGDLSYPAFREWRRRGAKAEIELFAELGTIGRAIAKLTRITAIDEVTVKPRRD
jgi:hypothetical protein